MKFGSLLLVTLVFIFALSAPSYPGEINCGVAGQAPCVVAPTPTPPPSSGDMPGTPDPVLDTTEEEVFWEVVLSVVQGALSVF